MAEILDRAMIFTEQYQICLFIKEVPIIWDKSSITDYPLT
jgi:hypothetical protein